MQRWSERGEKKRWKARGLKDPVICGGAPDVPYKVNPLPFTTLVRFRCALVCYLTFSFPLALFLPMQQVERTFLQCACKTNSHQLLTNCCLDAEGIILKCGGIPVSCASSEVTELACWHWGTHLSEGLCSWWESKGKKIRRNPNSIDPRCISPT